jgi:hypothetical protein
MTRGYLLKAFPASLQRGTLVVGFDPEFADYLPLVDTAKNLALLQNKLRELDVPDAQVRFAKLSAPVALVPASPAPAPIAPTAPTSAPAPSPSASPTAPPAPPQAKPSADAKPEKAKPTRLDPSEFKNDPLIKQALEIFKAQIVEVRA